MKSTQRWQGALIQRMEPRWMLNAGDLDTAFGTNGASVSTFGATGNLFGQISVSFDAVAVQADGKIVAAGETSPPGDVYESTAPIVVARFNSNGSLDTTFNGTGFELTTFGNDCVSADSVAIRSNGQILISGQRNDFSRFVARLHADGSLDTSFGNHGVLTGDQGPFKLAGGEIYSVDSELVSRYTPNGKLDSTFGDAGSVNMESSNESAQNVAVQSDGSLLVIGTPTVPFNESTNKIRVMKFTSTGQSDFSFNDSGVVDIAAPVLPALDTLGLSVSPLPDGKILIVSSGESQTGVAELDADGMLDSSFGDAGWVVPDHFPTPVKSQQDVAYGVAVQADGKIVLAGQSGNQEVSVERLNTDGSPDYTFSVDGSTTSSIGESARAVAIGADGKIIVVGATGDLVVSFPDKPSDAFVAEFDATGGENSPVVRSDQGELGITGTSGNDVISVETFGTLDTPKAKWGLDVTFNGTSSSYIMSHIKSIFIHGGDGDDQISVTGSDPFFSALGIDATLIGEGGDDSIVSDAMATVEGEAGDDHLFVRNGGSISGGDGDDHLFAVGDAEILDGGNGNDIEYGDVRSTLLGDAGNDHLYGGNLADKLYGGPGRDHLDGGSGNDLLNGGGGADTMYGQGGNDLFYAKDSSADLLFGGSGNDSAQIDSRDQTASIEKVLG